MPIEEKEIEVKEDIPVIAEKIPLTLSSEAFTEGQAIPAVYTCDGTDINPPLAIPTAPAETKGFALIVDDPDAPAGDWVHWLVWNISPGTNTILTQTVPKGAVQGKNDFGKTSYGGPCPPSGTHRYMFKLYALDAKLDLASGANKAALLKAMKGHILDQTTLSGTYSR
ncbi:YbhB/YbcL family Raf kinase inhibitor-like protein [Patescibacteria group bacterium]|nr:YbhB/YbcL family Raf kinase inhibitor-like protein [Patescibacteria group bacterium]MBU1721600.1 YbhB/YbcL family Raf kinase inhibitor-like protein [Patescibacteria group bacterium]MBU1901826.1 YbhB/YbcL family Raf kinase inhibitor-like protein [Patescibacteria group bacterium]